MMNCSSSRNNISYLQITLTLGRTPCIISLGQNAVYLVYPLSGKPGRFLPISSFHVPLELIEPNSEQYPVEYPTLFPPWPVPLVSEQKQI